MYWPKPISAVFLRYSIITSELYIEYKIDRTLFFTTPNSQDYSQL